MNTKPKKVKKVKVTLSITKEAQDIMLDHGYASSRTMGDFISELIMEHHRRMTGTFTREELAKEIHRLVELLAASASTDTTF
jgi:hypothetical protein